MENTRHIWIEWAKLLHRWGMERWVRLFFSEFGSLNLLLAQGLYLIEPLIPTERSAGNLRALCALLEDASQQEFFLALLEEQGRLLP